VFYKGIIYKWNRRQGNGGAAGKRGTKVCRRKTTSSCLATPGSVRTTVFAKILDAGSCTLETTRRTRKKSMGAVIQKIDEVRQDYVYEDIVQAIKNGNRTLDMKHRNLRNVPPILSRLDEIVEVSLAHNMLTTLPNSIGSMKSLQILRLQNCQLEALPETFGDLSQLRILDVSRNDLIDLPDSFGRLIALEEL